MMNITLIFGLLMMTILSNSCLGQQNYLSGNPNAYSLPEDEQKVLSIYSKWVECTTNHDCHDDEKLNFEFVMQLSFIIYNRPTSFDYPFAHLVQNEVLRVFKSDDNKLKIYNFNKITFTEKQDCYTYYQWKNGDQTITRDASEQNGHHGAFLNKISAVYTINIKGKKHYLILANQIRSTNDISQSISCITLDKKLGISKSPIFKVGDQLASELQITYQRTTLKDPLEDVDSFRQSLNQITYDNNQQKIFIPNIVDGALQKSYQVYQLKGSYIQYVTTETK